MFRTQQAKLPTRLLPILLNLGNQNYAIEKGDRIAQLVIAKFEAIDWEEGDLGESVRGEGGFGSSGR